jgi:thioredoxin reductase (NADPH)
VCCHSNEWFVAASNRPSMDSPACLVVDDDRSVLASLVGDLEHRFGEDYELFSALNGQAGLELLDGLVASGRRVALIIADLRMAGMSGLDLLSHARRLQPLAKRVVLIDVRDFASYEPLHRAMTLGQVDCWLTKPWDPATHLYPVIDELLAEWVDDAGLRRFAAVQVVDEPWAARSRELRDLLDRHTLSYLFQGSDTVEGREVLRRAGQAGDRLPVLVLFDGQVLVQPTNAEVAEALGVRTRPEGGRYDVAVLGAGPAGLSAAVCSASEGLRTVLIEREAFGGQAGTSSRVRNYLGFPRGVSGKHLAGSAREQAVLFGVETVYSEATGLRQEGPERVVLLKDGGSILARAVVIATGVAYRRLGVPSVEDLVGAGVFYGSSLADASALRGEDVVVVGGANSAAQAAVYLCRFARHVLLVARGESLSETMSAYLINELRSLDNVTVRLRTQVVDAAGHGRLEQVTLAAGGSGARETIPAAALFILIGTEPRTEWLEGTLERDADGFILTGRDVPRQGVSAETPPAREPLLHESSLAGVFAIGDVRANSVKRVSSAVGEGSMAVWALHQHLHNLLRP